MPFLELFPKPSRPPNGTQERTLDPAADQAAGQTTQPLKVRTQRYGDLEEHEVLHLIDSFDDERSRARFRESIYISIIIYLAIAWFLVYGPRVLFHQPRFQDPISLMKQHDLQQLSLNVPRTRPAPKVAPKIDRKTMEQLQQQARVVPPTPQPPAPPQEEAHTSTPPVTQPPLPSAPKPAQSAVESPLPSAPRPNVAPDNQSARNSIQDAMRGAISGRGSTGYGPSPGSRGPLQAGAEILSDTQGVDFTAYMRRLHDDIQRNWDPLIPPEVQPPLLKKGITGIRFTILPDGTLANPMILETKSGDVALDKAAWYAITSEGKFPPLPKEYHGPQLELRVGFFYNIPLPE